MWGGSNYRRRGAWHACEDRLRRWPVKAENRRGGKGLREGGTGYGRLCQGGRESRRGIQNDGSG